MSGVGLLGTLLLGTGYIYPTSSIGSETLVAYNGYEFINVKRISSRYDRAGTQLSSFETIRTDGRGYDLATQDIKEITIEGTLQASDALGLQNEIDSLIQAVGEQNNVLYTRRKDTNILVCNATCTGVELPEEHYHINFIPYKVTFTVLDPYLYSEDLIEESRTGVVSAMNENFTLTAGNEKPSPFILIQCGSGTSTTSISIELNGVIITCDVGLTNGDSLLINHKNKEVSKNGSQSFEFSGEFAKMKFGTNNIKVSYTGTLQAYVYVLYYPTYA